jgi:hypothetical protein
MGGSSFLNAFMPTLPWWFLVLALASLAAWATVTRVRLWHAQQLQAERPARALRQARDGLAAANSDPGLGDVNRDQVLAAYDAVKTALTKEKDDS